MISGEECGEAGLKGMKGNFLFIERYDIFFKRNTHCLRLVFLKKPWLAGGLEISLDKRKLKSFKPFAE